MRDSVLEKETVTHMTNKCDTCDAVFVELFLLTCIFVQSIGTLFLVDLF